MTPLEMQQKLQDLAKKSGLAENQLQYLLKSTGLPQLQTKTQTILAKYITEDKDLQEVKQKCLKLSTTTRPVLILGETGTGKELLAQALHGNRDGLFVAVNCAGVSESLLEAEFFGATKGAYTGCTQDRVGYFEHARNGTIFLDEVGELPLSLQVKFLRVIESKTFRKVGSVIEQPLECRIISATNILDLAKRGDKFRQDLYYRLAGSILQTKPLRDRRVDIQNICVSLDKDKKLPMELIQTWTLDSGSYPFYGNVRELINMISEQLELGD